jgi:menaquinol-cytochrome c reductase iron-sulfur subunit
MLRRGFLTAGVSFLGGAIAGGLAWIGGAFVTATSRWPVRSAKKWSAICTFADLKGDEPLAASFSFRRLEGWYVETVTRQVYVTKDAEGRPVVLSRRCTHLGCPVSWKLQSRTFRCPCHGGVFDEQGRVTRWPPPRGLDVLESRIAGEMIEVAQA